MVWHIFKKDWKLLWPFFAAVAAAQFIPGMLRLRLGLFGEDPVLSILSKVAAVIAMVSTAFLVAVIVHQDSIPGLRQDWLVRPVRRSDLLLAKLLFAVAVVQGSVLAADGVEALASGFSLGPSLSVAFSHSLFLLAMVTLPALALASVTRDVTEAISGAVMIFCAGMGIVLVYILIRGTNENLYPTAGTGVSWMSTYLALTSVTLMVGAVLATQFFRRKTIRARWLIGIALVLYMVSGFLPWRAAFGLQQHLSPRAGAGGSVAVAFDAGLGRFQRPSGMTMADEEVLMRLRHPDRKSQVFVPLRFSGLLSDTVLKADKSEIRLTSSDGGVLYRGYGDDLEIRKDGPSTGEAGAHQEMDLPGALYSRIKAQPLRLEIDYSLTLFGLNSAQGIPALNGNQRSPGLGWCATQMNESETSIELRCLQTRRNPICGAVFLENTSSGSRNPVESVCQAGYSPSVLWDSDEPMGHLMANLYFRDPSGLTNFPVDGPQLPKSQVVVRLYEPQDHFTRQVVIPAITLQDWESK